MMSADGGGAVVFGELVRKYRRCLGLTQEDLAARTGVHSRTIAKIEVGQILAPRQSTIRLFADAFSLTGPDRDAFFQAAARAPARPALSQPVPSQLPRDVAEFIGRREQLLSLDQLRPGRVM